MTTHIPSVLAAATARGHSCARRAPVRVLAADRQPLFREAVARAVRQRADFQLVAEVGDGRSALDMIERKAPDVAVVDAQLPDLDGARVLNAVIRDGIRTRVLLVSGERATSGAYDAIEAGAAGFLSKAADEEELCEAIATIARGDTAIAADVQKALAEEIRRRRDTAEPVLSDRECDVLALVADGHSARDIGLELHLSTGTVKSTLLKIYKRLGVGERAAAVAVAIRRGLID